MSQNVNWNNQLFVIPDTGNKNWGDQVTSYLIALCNGALPKSAGLFTLTAEVDFGASFGLKALYYKSRTSNVSSTGIVRLANNSDSISWRNAANNADLALAVNSSNQLTFNGTAISGSATLTAPLASLDGVVLTNATRITVSNSALASGDNDLYTVPAGKRAIVTGFLTYNSTGGAITVIRNLKRSGTYYRMSATNAGTVGSAAQGELTTNLYVFEPGDIIALNTSAANLTLVLSVLLFDNTVSLYSPTVLALTSGDNILYTVPSGKTSRTVGNALNYQGSVSGSFTVTNTTGGAINCIGKYTPNGGSAISIRTASATDNSSLTGALPSSLNALDVLTINSDTATAGQVAWCTVYES